MKFNDLASVAFLSVAVMVSSTFLTAVAYADLAVTMSGKITKIEGDKLVVSDGNGQFIVDTKREILDTSKLAVGEYISVDGPFDSDKIEAYTITRNKQIVYRDDSKKDAATTSTSQ